MTNTAKTYNFENMKVNKEVEEALKNIVSDKLFKCNVSTEHAAQIAESIIRYGIRNQKAVVDSLKIIAPEFEAVSERVFNYLEKIAKYNQENLQEIFKMDIENAKCMSAILNDNIKTRNDGICEKIKTVGKDIIIPMGKYFVTPACMAIVGREIAKGIPAMAKFAPKIIKAIKC